MQCNGLADPARRLVGITVLGMVLFGDPVTWLHLAWIALIIVAVAGLSLVEG